MLPRVATIVVCALFGLDLTAPIAAAPPTAARYIQIDFLLDNSPSMEIGATPGDIAALLHLTPCSPGGAAYGDAMYRPGNRPQSGQTYSAYQCSQQTGDSDDARPLHPIKIGGLDCPIPAAQGVTDAAIMQPGMMAGPRCTNLPAKRLFGREQIATAGPPCAFACHWDAVNPPGKQTDFYAVARSTIGQPPCYQPGARPGACAITLRFDLVKNAVARAIDTMDRLDRAGAAHVSAGVFTFDTGLHAVYPSPAACGTIGSLACQAGRDWPRALNAVGTAPSQPNVMDAGIQPFIGRNVGATDFPFALTSLAHTYLTRSGDGLSSDAPQKILLLITDGMDDHFGESMRTLGAPDPRLCQAYKDMGYRVFVLDTPYIPLMNPFYTYNVKPIAESKGPNSIAAHLRQCASDPARDFLAAAPEQAASISDAVKIFIKRAVSAP